MSGIRTGPRDRVAAFFAVDDPWERQGTVSGRDVVVGAVTLAFSVLALELTRSVGVLEHASEPVWTQWLAVALGAGLLVGRRRWPLTVTALAALHMFVVGVTMPAVMAQLSLQIVYFIAIMSGVAWARARRDMLVVVGIVIAFMFTWLAWQFALGSGVDEIRRGLGDDAAGDFGVVSPVAASLVLAGLVNVMYFGGAVVIGQFTWRGARQRARLAEQAELLRSQGERLRQRAVLEERLRIARELHDVVAHHVSVIGIQAGAARKVLARDPDAAARALTEVERSSREAVTQMRGLLGTLRAVDGEDDPQRQDRSPEPGLADLPALVDSHRVPGFTVSHQLVESPEGTAARVPAPVALTLYRTAQEALANVRRHSTARRVGVVLRVTAAPAGGYAEIEVVDDGRPRGGTSGSGLGLLGIRERVASHRGEVEIGPRGTGGYRVRVRLPLPQGPAEPEPAGAADREGDAG
ncbi:MAG: sensor histidine kinase [Actinomycetales bacterium]|nr:sensor histidine kinase [Actinomycetales bacterium]